MRKITTLFAMLLMATFTFAQKIVFVNNGQEIAKGSTVVINALELTDEFGTYVEFGTSTKENIAGHNLGMKNVGGMVSKGVSVTATQVSATERNFAFCPTWGQDCHPFKEKVTVSGDIAAGAVELLAIHTDVEAEDYFTAKLKVQINDGTADNFIFIEFVYAKSTGIEAAQGEQNCFVADGQFVYSFADAASRQLNVYNVAGVLVKSVNLDQAGNVSLTELSKGLYIYQVRANGRPVQAHKCVID